MKIPEEKGLMVMGHERVTMRDFLLKLDQSLGIISLACQKAGISRATFYNWRDRDEWFADVSEQVIEEAKPRLHDLAKHGLIKKIMEGDNACIIFYLKTRHPEFKEKLTPKEQEDVDEVIGNVSLVDTIKAINQTLNDEGFTPKWQKKIQ